MTYTPTTEQALCIEALVSGAPMLQVRACAGSGKEQPLDTLIQTPVGPRQFGSLRVGDEVFGANGQVTTVTAIYPQGVKPVYEVTFRDGTSTRCGLEHNWAVKNYKKYVTRTLAEILEMGILNSSGSAKFQIPLTLPVEYPDKALPIPAYVLGVIIGDGALSLTTPAVSVSDRDIEILHKLKACVPSVRFTEHRTGLNVAQYTMSDNTTHSTKKSGNRFKSAIDSLQLNVTSRDKYIPSMYLQSGINDRMDLLRGLMDADGTTRNGRTSFSTMSCRLAKNIQTLVQSLGGTAIIRKPMKRDGEISVNIKTMFNPFLACKYKASRWKAPLKNPPSRYITKVELIGEVEQMCITVAAEDALYLTDQFIVTHNTSTLVLMAEAVRKPSLYLAFNKATADEGTRKFPTHVRCSTTHSRAYAAFGSKLRDKLSRPKGKYKNVAGTGSEIARYYGIESFEDSSGTVVPSGFIGILVKETVARFEQSAEEVLSPQMVPTYELRRKLNDNAVYVATIVQQVFKAAQKLWEERISPTSPVLATHDTYLKLFQLSKPVFSGVQVLYVDEFQDTTPCVLDIAMNQRQHMQVVMVGDARQAIYGWRGAVNAMEMVRCKTLSLTKSFRYGQTVADVATAVLERDMVISGNEALTTIAGFYGVVDRSQPYTRLFRTNAALLGAAVEEIAAGTKVAIEIDVKDFVKLLESALALHAGDMKNVKHEKLSPFTSFYEMVAESTTDAELGRLVKVVSEGVALQWLSVLQSHVNADYPHVTFTTAHKSKGREWEQVIVEDDFKSCRDEDGAWIGLQVEEQNLLYVAVTRAQGALEYNFTTAQYMEVDELVKATLKSNLNVLKEDVRHALST